MATYNITKSDGNPGPAIADAASPDTQTDLQLVGQNAVSYGLDVATSFYWLLEHFASTTAPTTGSAGRVTGQIWYDTTPSTRSLNVYNGATFDQVASSNTGTLESAVLRWDDTNKKYTEDTRITIDGSGSLAFIGPTPGNSVAFSHDDTDLNITGLSTGAIDIDDGSISTVRLPEITLTTALDETYGGTAQTSYVAGDILFASGSNVLAKLAIDTNGDVLTLVGGFPAWVTGSAGVSTFNDLTDVNLAGAANNDLLYRSGGDWIDTAGAATWDGTTLNATRFGSASILSADLIDRSAPGTLAATTFSGTVTFNADLDLQDNDRIRFGTGDDVDMDFDAIDLVINANTAVDFEVTGFSGALRVDTAIFSGITGSGGGEMKVLGTTNSNSTNVGFVSVNHNDDGQQQIRMGTRSGSSFSEINALVDDLNLYAANTLVFNIDPTQTTITEGGVSAMNWHAVSGTNTTTSAGVFDNVGAERNVGFNETPEQVQNSSTTIDETDIGKFMTRTTSTSRIWTLSSNTNIPIGGSLLVHNDHTTGTLTIATTQTLQWIDGSDAAPPTGSRTLAYNSIATVRKKSSTVWQIWGNGIS